MMTHRPILTEHDNVGGSQTRPPSVSGLFVLVEVSTAVGDVHHSRRDKLTRLNQWNDNVAVSGMCNAAVSFVEESRRHIRSVPQLPFSDDTAPRVPHRNHIQVMDEQSFQQGRCHLL
jgi:hypothetical protein